MLPLSPEWVDRYERIWSESQVESRYLASVAQAIRRLASAAEYYNPNWDSYDRREFRESIEGMAYTVTELLAQFCSGGKRWLITDKARFLSPTVSVAGIIKTLVEEESSIELVPREFFIFIELGSWDFLQVAERTHTWFEALNFTLDEVRYLLWAAHRALRLLGAEERIPGFTQLALSNDEVLEQFCRCESPIESVLYMQLVVDGLLPPILQTQWQVNNYRLDLAVPDRKIDIECDGLKYHNPVTDRQRDEDMRKNGWFVIRFSAREILEYPALCSEKVLRELGL